MAQLKIQLDCLFCENKHIYHVVEPNASGAFESIYRHEEQQIELTAHGTTLCPEHAAIKEWHQTQCLGCVMCFGDGGCGVFKDFARHGSMKLTEQDMNTIKSGYCPRRSNGTTMLHATAGVRSPDFSERSSVGEQFAKAILGYRKLYCSNTPNLK